MNALRSNLMKFVSILFIFLGIATIYIFVSPLGIYFSSNYEIHRSLSELLPTVSHPKLVFGLIIGLGALEIAIGVFSGIKYDAPSKAIIFIVSGFILGAISLLCMLLYFQFTELIGFMLSVLYIIDGVLSKKATT